MKKWLALIFILIAAGFFVFISLKGKKPVPVTSKPPDESARIVSTKPDSLSDTIIPANQVIEISFNKPLQNIPEFKVRIEPKIEFKVELSSDRKTARIKPVKPFDLGTSYTLTINPDTKFDGVGEWGQTKDFHFRTITYKG